MARMVIAELCPRCGSLDVRVSEPRWFHVELDRRAQFSPSDDGWVERIEFHCRTCALVWD